MEKTSDEAFIVLFSCKHTRTQCQYIGQTEAFPEPLNFWKRRSDNRILEQNDKFRMETYTDGYGSWKCSYWYNHTHTRARAWAHTITYTTFPSNDRRTDSQQFPFVQIIISYKSWMRLNISHIRSEDFGEYQCVSKNDINTTAATFFVYGYYHCYLHCSTHPLSDNGPLSDWALWTITVWCQFPLLFCVCVRACGV